MRRLIRSGPERDLRVDLARGLALWMIFVNHAPNNALRPFTLHRVTLIDAADVFVLLAGYASGLVYGKTLDRHGWGRAAGAALHRAGAVYVAHIFTLVLLVALVGWVGKEGHLREMNLLPLAQWPMQALCEAMLLRYQPTNADILPIYVVLLTILGITAPLLRRPVLLLGAAMIVWAAAWTLGLNLPNWPEGGWNLNPLAWQLIFLTGAALGYRPPDGPARSVPFWWPLALACLVLLLVARPLYALRGQPELLMDLPEWLAGGISALPPRGPHNKTFQNPLRLASLLALAYLAGHFVPRGASWLRSRFAAAFVLMGQHGLAVFCTTVALSFLARVAIEALGGGGAAQAGVNVVGLAILIAVAAVAAWFKPERGAVSGRLDRSREAHSSSQSDKN